MRIEDYDYNLPKDLIAKYPPKIRGESNLLVYNTKTDKLLLTKYKKLDQFVDNSYLIVRNITRVFNSRLFATAVYQDKMIENIEVFILSSKDVSFKSFLKKQLVGNAILIPCLVKLKRRILSKLEILDLPAGWKAKVKDFKDEVVEMYFINDKIKRESLIDAFIKLIDKYGHVPIPPYLQRKEEKLDNYRYQTVFGKITGSVAAPTASLNFTENLISRLQLKGVNFANVVLHVGLGTFKPLNEEMIKSKRLHKEFVYISKDDADLITSFVRDSDKKVLAIGTTVVRALESFLRFNGDPSKGFATDIFIYPPFKFMAIDALLTNFHFPRTSLLALVDAFLQHKRSPRTWRFLYDFAISHNLRFYSYGDSMLII